MVQITFYSVPQLNDRYFDVLDNDTAFWKPKMTPLEAYLSLYEGPVFTLDNYYLTDGGTLNVSLNAISGNADIYGYSYMKMVDVDRPNNVRYCFIDHIELANNLAIVDYSVDTWHTYSGKMEIHNAIFDRALLGITRKKALPIAYTTNQPFRFDNITKKKMFIVAEISEYHVTDNPQEATLKHNFTTVIGRKAAYTVSKPDEKSNVPVPYYATNINYLFDADEAREAIDELTAYQGVKSKKGQYENFVINESTVTVGKRYRTLGNIVIRSKHFTDNTDFNRETVSYELTQLFVVPEDAIEVSELFDFSGILEYGITICKAMTLQPDNLADYELQDYGMVSVKTNITNYCVKHKTIHKNPLIVGFGNLSTFIPDSYDGLDHYYDIFCVANNYGFSIGLKLSDGSFSDISSQFEIPLPFTTQNGAERQQQAMAKQMAKAQLLTSIVGGAVSLGTGLASGITHLPVAGISEAAHKAGTMARMSQERAYKKKHPGVDLNAQARAAGTRTYNAAYNRYLEEHPQFETRYDISKIAGSGLTGLGSALAGLGAFTTISSPVAIADSNNLLPNALLNATYGFSVYIISPDNNTEVEDAIKRTGYLCQIISDDIHKGMQPFDLKKAGYDVIHMADGYVSGPFSQDVAKELEEILRNGFRIHY